MAELTPNASPPPDCEFGKKVGPTRGKSESADGSADVSPQCPRCGSKKLWRDGNSYTIFKERIQR